MSEETKPTETSGGENREPRSRVARDLTRPLSEVLLFEAGALDGVSPYISRELRDAGYWWRYPGLVEQSLINAAALIDVFFADPILKCEIVGNLPLRQRLIEMRDALTDACRKVAIANNVACRKVAIANNVASDTRPLGFEPVLHMGGGSIDLGFAAFPPLWELLAETIPNGAYQVRRIGEALKGRTDNGSEGKPTDDLPTEQPTAHRKAAPSRTMAAQSLLYAYCRDEQLIDAPLAQTYNWLKADKRDDESNPYHGARMPKEKTWKTYVRGTCKREHLQDLSRRTWDAVKQDGRSVVGVDEIVYSQIHPVNPDQ